MYFMNICAWSPEDEKEVEKRRESRKWPKGVNVIFEFIDLQPDFPLNYNEEIHVTSQ
jgi:hypothetical protein